MSLQARISSLRPDAETTALAAGALFLVAWGVVHTWFWAHGQLVDWPVYRTYGDAVVRHGRVPYRDFGVEYPPAALPTFVLPSFFGDYAGAFAWTMCACGVALVFVVARIRPVAAWYVALAPVLVGSLILSRFDLWPALLTAAALLAVVSGRTVTGWILLALAVAAKLWPAVLVPLLLVHSYRRGDRRAPLAGLGALVVVVLPFAVVAPHGLWESVRGQASRPLQIESLGASVFTAFSHPQVISSHGSQNVAGHATAASLVAALQVAALVALWAAYARGPAQHDRLLRYAAAAVCAFVVFDKVLSPQYLIWLVPLVPLVRGRRGVIATVALTVACVLTQVWFPARYWAYADGLHLAGVVLARNLVLASLLVVLAWPHRVARPA
jgi:uncharacterized membrane protein